MIKYRTFFFTSFKSLINSKDSEREPEPEGNLGKDLRIRTLLLAFIISKHQLI